MPTVIAAKKCCEDKPRCSDCPIRLLRLEKMGYAVKTSKRTYKVSSKIPKKDLVAARAR